MNKKFLGIFVSLLVVAMFVLPMSVAFAEKPTITMNISGKYYVLEGSTKTIVAGESGNTLMKINFVLGFRLTFFPVAMLVSFCRL